MSTERTVRELMTAEVAVLNANDSLSVADDVMRLGRIRHMPVVEQEDDEEVLVGIVSQRDLLRGALAKVLGYGEHAQSRLLAGLSVKEVMTTQVLTAHEETPIREAAQLMIDHKVGCLIVVDGRRPTGILTESDFVGAILESG
jgi:CBS domain-containing protein